jgi:hypothetical protein
MKAGTRLLVIDDALRSCAEEVEQTQAGRWRVTIGNGFPIDLDARDDDGWLMFSRPAGRASAAWFRVLCLNSGLDLASRVGLEPLTSSLHLLSEVPAGDDVNLPARIREACTGLGRALARLGGVERVHDDTTPAAAVMKTQMSEIADLCRESGWRAVERRDGALSVELDVAGACHQAIGRTDDGAVGVSVEIARWERATPAARDALAILLLSACRAHRFVRASASETGEAIAARFEVRFGGRPHATELDEALRAMSVACRLYAREADVLQDESIATDFVARLESARPARESARGCREASTSSASPRAKSRGEDSESRLRQGYGGPPKL